MNLKVNAVLSLTGLFLFAVLHVYGQDVLIEFEEDSPFYETKVSKAKPSVVLTLKSEGLHPDLREGH